MALKQINAYPAASTIDAVNDQLLIDPGGTGIYNKINRNTLLGITGAPLGTSDTQTISNKIIGNTNAITVKDGSFTLNNSSDTSKVGIFSLANVTTATTRTYTLPNASVTLASLTGTETFTNKTLTAPIINGGTITAPTLAIDAITGNSTSTIVTVANLQISNGVLNSANAVTSTSIAAGAVTPNALLASTGTGWVYQSWTPTFSNWTVGTGGSAGTVAKYVQIGKTVLFYLHSILGTSGESVGTNPSFSLPVAATTSLLGQSSTPIGNLVAVSAGTLYGGQVWAGSTTTASPIFFNASGTYATTAAATATVPNTWTAGDRIDIVGSYEAA